MSLMNVKSQMRQSGGSFSINSASYTDWLDASGGNTVAPSITKAFGDTDLVVEGGAIGQTSGSNDTFFTAVSDGTTDFELGRIRLFTAGKKLNARGAVMLTGLGAGAISPKLRAKCADASNAITFATGSHGQITVYEVNGSAPYGGGAICRPCSSTHAISASGSYIDLKYDGTNAVSLTFTKKQGPTVVLVKNFLSIVGNTASAGVVTCGLSVNGTDYDMSLGVTDNTLHGDQEGERVITGLAAGTVTIVYRIKCTVAQNFTVSVHAASIMALEMYAG